MTIKTVAVATLLLVAVVSTGAVQASERRLSAADDRKAIHVHVGETVMVAMHADDFVWKLRNTNPAVLAPVRGLKLKAGIQGVFRAKAPGSATLELEGTPKCAPGFTDCAPFVRSVIFPVTVGS